MDGYQHSSATILAIINNKEELLQENMTILELLDQKKIKKRSAIWLNGKQLLQAEYPVIKIKDGDTIKILKVVAGG